METNPGVTVIGAEAPSAYQMAPRTKNANQIGGGGSAPVDVSPVSVGLTGSIEKKKRGRPRKYGPDGTMARALSPMPISSSVPPSAGEFSNSGGGKRGRGRGSGYQMKHHKGIDMESLGEWAATSVGTNFTPHVITVNAGEDVTMKVISFSQQGPRAICILSANGVISNVTLRQPDSSGGTLTYEGRFEILSLSGSFMPTETQGTRSRSGGMNVSLASADGRVVGGGVAGLLIAASPVQVVVGSFLPGNQNDQKHKKQKIESMPATVAPIPSIVTAPDSNAEKEDGMDVVSPQQNLNGLKPNLAAAAFLRENWVTTMQEPRNSATDINISLPAG
ncbi:AT-hook motif nuclear-localized protein 1 [Hibiscus syriacus]|uniref:AT-hook motif nuclear-localized protein n=1 Tax=Hibiscus syriacus TaxID=106335 RepID=A0A6A2ZZU1_HIBSY|nr:AT-hook motif nuclear-localized protein 7-like [Hibiscus syriacus]XP_039008048.1 AT-hook motif nuclear-localized protein 7-like [Hibiscus syriacus]XP_039008049.1 AT-hook motif nuclear-localized protein 7-like [Hibiscus syriacus]KAE8697534.1 AT-hook motif nuclear-localized protein 1 [Hibiscus syriacus]